MLGVSMSALRNWEKADPSGKPLGRPRISAEERECARLIVAMEWCTQGLGAGEPSIGCALRGHVSRTLVRESLKSLKLDYRRRVRGLLEATRKHIEVGHRDTMWSHDATELARGVACEPPADATPVPTPGPGGQAGPSGSILGLPNASDPSVGGENGSAPALDGNRLPSGAGIIQAEMIRDVASTRTLQAFAGAPADGDEIVALLERTAAGRGTWPLVLVTDNGGPYRSNAVAECLEAHQVVHLFNEPHTPEHNAWVEHGHGEHQEEMALAADAVTPGLEDLRARLARATFTLDHCRLRATRGWQTAHQYDLGLPPAGGVISRAVFYEAAYQAVARATKGLDGARERRRAEREAILATLQSFGLINRTRGGVPVPEPQRALIT
jgi:transposase InsO family protein